MENNILKFKAEFFAEYGECYSVCMRGARLWDKSKPLNIYDNGNGDLIETAILVTPKYTATVLSQIHMMFNSLTERQYKDNYDRTARTFTGLLDAMKNVYPDFDGYEIVTILRFRIDDYRTEP